jgi:spore coat protein CotF
MYLYGKNSVWLRELLKDQIENTKQLEKELTKYMEEEHRKSGFLRSQATEASSAIS